MAFETYDATVQSVSKGLDLLNQLRSLYANAKQAQEKLALYQAGTDTKFNNTINNVFTSGERSTLGSMLSNINSLITAWEADPAIRQALGLP